MSFENINVPGLDELSEALAIVLPEDDSQGDPQYLARSALAMANAAKWGDDELLTRALDCASRYWSGEATEQEREKMREAVVDFAESLRSQGYWESSPEWCKYALAMSSLDTLTPSNGYAASYIVRFALKAGISLTAIRESLEKFVPGLTEQLSLQRRR